MQRHEEAPWLVVYALEKFAILRRQACQAHMGFRHENVCVLHDVYPGQKKSLKARACAL